MKDSDSNADRGRRWEIRYVEHVEIFIKPIAKTKNSLIVSAIRTMNCIACMVIQYIIAALAHVGCVTESRNEKV